jgi:hypothetical protein
MSRKRERQIQKEKDKGIIEMAAEQFAILLWKQQLWNKENKTLNSRQKNYLYLRVGPSGQES